MLEHSDIAHYLLSLDLVKPRTLVEGSFTVVDVSRRNCVFLAATPGGPTYVVKQAGHRSARTLAQEATVLPLLAQAIGLAGHVPSVVLHDPDAALLVLETPSGARDWNEHHRSGRAPLVPARILGRVLGALHGLQTDRVQALPANLDPMWGLSLAEPSHELVLELSAGAQDLLGRVQASPELCARLDALRHSGSEGSFVHGDLRWDNCLAFASPGSRRRTRVLLVDWEYAGPGAAAFDVGTVLAEYLRFWVASIPIVESSDPGRLAANARHPLRCMHPAIQAFWLAYRGASPLRPTLRHVVELAAVRLLQTAMEQAQELAEATAHVVTLVQLADNMLRAPDSVGPSLLGLQE